MDKRYEVILFDCFNTVFLPDSARLPMTVVNGKPTPSTAGMLSEQLRHHRDGITPEAVYRAHREAWRWAESQRGEEVREVPAHSRFRHMLGLLGLNGAEDELVERLLGLHTNLVANSYVLPAAYAALLRRLEQRHRLALFSNFDYAPALRRLLRGQGLDALFDPIVISAEIGYRKPGKAAFDLALAPIPQSREAILFVGDSLADDVAGAAGAGLAVVWVSGTESSPPEGAQPNFAIRDLTHLEALLQG